MTAAARTKRRISVPTVASGPLLRGPVDVRTEGCTTIVTLDLPTFLLAEIRWEINAGSLVIRSADPVRLLHLPILLPGPPFTGRFVLVVNGTIFDFRMERHKSNE
ncbi:MAG TPA: hypothetical protein VGB18_02890 [Candidatus Thermoplasmatota archaeon]